jgi:hypothetical protein
MDREGRLTKDPRFWRKITWISTEVQSIPILEYALTVRHLRVQTNTLKGLPGGNDRDWNIGH